MREVCQSIEKPLGLFHHTVFIRLLVGFGYAAAQADNLSTVSGVPHN